MFSKNVEYMIIAAALPVVSINVIPANNVWAANIVCPPFTGSNVCNGTPNNDNMQASSGRVIMRGNLGADNIAGKTGNDFIVGENGADRINGGAGDDIIFHGDWGSGLEGCPVLPARQSDGSRDLIDCGAGFDRAVINVSVDHDLAQDCEQVLSG
jgi:Ca2+-binding RTX toxin-like protein